MYEKKQFKLTVTFKDGTKPVERMCDTAGVAVDKMFSAITYYDGKKTACSIKITDYNGAMIISMGSDGVGQLKSTMKEAVGLLMKEYNGENHQKNDPAPLKIEEDKPEGSDGLFQIESEIKKHLQVTVFGKTGDVDSRAKELMKIHTKYISNMLGTLSPSQIAKSLFVYQKNLNN